jgi:putative SOS response-associated peptidase YedK
LRIPPATHLAQPTSLRFPTRESFRRRRCLIVADGFYEWRKDGPRKTPYFIRLRSGRPFGFAGIWSLHRGAVETRNAACAIVTCAPNELMVPIHNRMPVILPAAARERWLDASANEVDLRALLVPLPPEEMDAYAISAFVNAPRNDSSECVRRVFG